MEGIGRDSSHEKKYEHVSFFVGSRLCDRLLGNRTLTWHIVDMDSVHVKITR